MCFLPMTSRVMFGDSYIWFVRSLTQQCDIHLLAMLNEMKYGVDILQQEIFLIGASLGTGYHLVCTLIAKW